jgi:hypothetical protein
MTTAALLRAAASALDDGRNPLANPFLSEHEVTLDQCFSLAEQLAIGARIVAAGIEDPRGLHGQAYFAMLAASA